MALPKKQKDHQASLSEAKDPKKIPKKGPKCAKQTMNAPKRTPETLYSVGAESESGGKFAVATNLLSLEEAMVMTLVIGGQEARCRFVDLQITVLY